MTALAVAASAEADALRQSADAGVQHDETGAASAKTLARQLAAERQRLEAGGIRYETWAGGHPGHQGRRRQGQNRTPTPRTGPATGRTAGPARQTSDDGRMVGRVRSGSPSCRTRHRSPAPGRHRRRRTLAATAHTEPNPSSAPEPDAGPTSKANPAVEPAPAKSEQDDRSARLDELLARADQAARRLAAQQAERQASSEYAARIEREAQAQPEAGRQAEARDQAEIEM